MDYDTMTSEWMLSELERDRVQGVKVNHRLESLQGQFQEICQSLFGRIQAIRQLCRLNRQKYVQVMQNAEKNIFLKQQIITDMNAIFQGLSKIKVQDQTLGKNLYDFVDSETVRNLQEEALKHVERIRCTLREWDECIQNIEKVASYYVDFDFDGMVIAPTSKDTWNVLESKAAFFSDTAVAYVTEQKRNTDRVRVLLERMHTTSGSSDDSTHANTVVAIESAKAQSNRLLQKIQDNQSELEHLYDSAVNFFLDMEQCDRLVLQNIDQIHACDLRFQPTYSNGQLLLDELHQLADFYREFHVAFQALRPELDRRERSKEYQHNLAQKVQKQFEDMYQKEAMLQQTFDERYGRFLPATLYNRANFLEDWPKYCVCPMSTPPSPQQSLHSAKK